MFSQRAGTIAFTLLLVLLSPATISAQEERKTNEDPSETVEKDPQLPKLKDLPTPTAEELIKGPAVDWIVLKNEGVIIAEPVTPRPDTLVKMQQKIEETKKWPRPVGKEEIQEHFRKREALNYLVLTLPGELEEAEYQIHIKFVAQVIHHEDLILRRVDLFLDEGKFRDAYELLFLLERSVPKWPGLAGRQKRLMLLEASSAVGEGQAEVALARLEELHARDSQFAGLPAVMSKAVDALVNSAIRSDDFPKARHYLERVRLREPQNEAFVRWRNDLQARAVQKMNEATNQESSGRLPDAAWTIRDAVRIWPSAPGVAEAFRRVSSRFQVLHVGVVRSSGEPTTCPFGGAAEFRQQRLTEAALFELDSFQDAARYRSPLLESWEPTDLGRQTQLLLKPPKPGTSQSGVLTASRLSSTLAAWKTPTSALYDERFANAVRSLSVVSPTELEIGFEQPPLRLESLLSAPLRSPQDPDSPLTPRFVVHRRDAVQSVFRRAVAESDSQPRRRIAEIVELKYPSHDEAMKALLRGDISMLPSLPIEDVDRLRQDSRFFVLKSALPITHLIQFHPRSRPLRQRELRRAMAYAIDRDRLLHEVILKSAPPDRGRLISGPYPRKSVAYNRSASSASYDPTIATALALAARKPLGGKLPELTMVCIPDPVAIQAAEKCIAAWAACGIKVRLQPQDAEFPPSSPWDMCYRTIQMAEPASELWPFLTASHKARVEDLQHLPQWLSRELVALDQAVDMATAIQLLKRLHDRLSAEMELIPLWEVDEFQAVRKNVRNLRMEPIHPYQDVEEWIVDPWFSAEPL